MAKRTYEDTALRVLWDSSLCIHTGKCIRSSDGVFEPTRRPWVDLTQADTSTVVAAIENCPTGALRYERLDGEPGEQPDVPTTVVPWPNGPLMVRGELEVNDRHGETFLAGPRAALCRCGGSKNQPFCDLTHKDLRFRDYPRVDTPERDAAAGPTDISPEELA
ncbi:MAG: (4Fe-4S)-binding protein [Acidimicrobiia bacterium]